MPADYEESLTARDENDELVKQERSTSADFEVRVRLKIDGDEVEVPKAVPATDAQGNIRRGADRKPIPRATTVYDAARKLVAEGKWTEEKLKQRIPVLCHAQHLDPVAVCRVCSVMLVVEKRGEMTVDRKCVPACQHRVERIAEVVTRDYARVPDEAVDAAVDAKHADKDAKERDELKQKARRLEADKAKAAVEIKTAGNLLVELLVGDHGAPDPKRKDRYQNELHEIAGGFGLVESADDPRLKTERILPSGKGALGRNAVGPDSPLHAKSRYKALELPLVPDTRTREDQRKGEPFWWETQKKTAPFSSASFHVDHDRCIVCDRCVRSCSDVKPFKVLGHTGRGNKTRISFDLDETMELSKCVKCGECMTACPTGAITINRRVAPKIDQTLDENPIPKSLDIPLPAGYLSTEEMRKVRIPYFVRTVKEIKDSKGKTLKPASERVLVDEPPTEGDRSMVLEPFAGIPKAYLRWNEGAARRRTFRDGEELCRQGDYGSTAYLIEKGALGVWLTPPGGKMMEGGLLTRLFGSAAAKAAGKPFKVATIKAETGIIAGELASMSNRPRTATLKAEGDTTVLEISRNMLSMLLRVPGSRGVLDSVYKSRAISTTLRNARFMQGVEIAERDKLIQEITPTARHYRLEPGQVVVNQGDREGDFYLVTAGFLAISRTDGGRTRPLAHIGKDAYIGEIALLNAMHAEREATRAEGNPDGLPLDLLEKLFAEHSIDTEYERTYPHSDPASRTATVAALDDAEVVFLPAESFGKLISHPTVLENLVKGAAETLKRSRVRRPLEQERQGDFLVQGLYQAQKLLALDLTSCTRCDECTKACAAAHGDGHSRLLREGMRFGNFLVATSCRSCHKPYCMEGCPVDAIHRKADGLQIEIEDHCIGCGLCEKQCPYGAIQIVPRESKGWELAEGKSFLASARKAVNCDLCDDLIPEGYDTFCVAACPHDAAKRVSGPELLEMVAKRSLV